MTDATAALEAKQLITEGLFRYCHGIDRHCVVDLQTISTTTGLIGEGRRDKQHPSYLAEGLGRLSSSDDDDVHDDPLATAAQDSA